MYLDHSFSGLFRNCAPDEQDHDFWICVEFCVVCLMMIDEKRGGKGGRRWGTGGGRGGLGILRG